MNKIVVSLIASVVLALIGVVGDFFINLAGEGKKFIDIKLLLIGTLIYGSTAFGWVFVMKYIKLSTIGVIYTVSAVLFLTILGVFYFKEPIGPYEIVGILFAIISIILVGKFA